MFDIKENQKNIKKTNDNNKVNVSSQTNKQEQAPPSISLPKGGSAIRGIGEKFAASPVTGAASAGISIYSKTDYIRSTNRYIKKLRYPDRTSRQVLSVQREH